MHTPPSEALAVATGEGCGVTAERFSAVGAMRLLLRIGVELVCSSRGRPQQRAQHSHPDESCTASCGHPLSSAPSGTRQSSTTPTRATKKEHGVVRE